MASPNKTTKFECEALQVLKQIQSELSDINGNLELALMGGMPFRCQIVSEAVKKKP